MKVLETVVERARRRPVLPAPQIPQARAVALDMVGKLPPPRAIDYLKTRAIPAFVAVAEASDAMLNRRIQDLGGAVLEKDPHAVHSATIQRVSHAAVQRQNADRAAKARELHFHFAARGIRLDVDAKGAICVTPGDILSADERTSISNYKPELLKLLQSTTTI
jgi:hypothetical protein